MKISRELLLEAMELAQINEDALRENVPYRCSGIKRCPGLDLDVPAQFYPFLAALGSLAADTDRRDITDENFSEVMQMAGSTRRDILGMGWVFYWPHLDITG